MRAVFANLRPGDVVWDVGANVGLYTILMATAVLPGGKVLGFEPMPACCERLAKNIAANDAPHVEGVPLALGCRSDRLYIMQCSSGLEGDIRIVTEAPAGTPSVEVIPGDVLRSQRGLAVPNMVKIDVQAAEEDVIIGMEATLKDPACRVIICEIHYAIYASRGDPNAPVRIERLLRDYGFHRIERIDRNHIGCWKV
jgi:FkbM family methyltransferase